ncbi:serine/threonine-protein kinase [Nonomuraea sp. NPDC050556]|uniref:serine/threonine-protein kinase n=1 Tax=Nonomuraea sp. NPDC050556 TaxID=3364369 RepID=UPI00378C8827
MIAGRYQLLTPLGSGGAGTVWRARDEVLHREVAVKEVRLPPELNGSETALIDTLREARAAAALNHPSIITVHDVIAEYGQPWIIMDLLAGQSLGDLVKQRGPLPYGQVATVGLGVLDALEAAHARGILHRDVKPGNVMITDAGEVILTDFGIAAHWSDRPGAATAAAASQEGRITGSPGYIAPEHLRGEPAGPAADLWSLAAALYAAVEGYPPFHRDTTMATIAAVLTVHPAPPQRAGPLGGLLMAMLDKNPAARPHPQVVRQALQSMALPLPTRRQETAPATVPVKARRSRVPLVVLGVLAGTAAAVTGVVLVNGGSATPPASSPSASPVAASSTPVPTKAATAVPPQAKRGDGTFGRLPDACELLTDAQVQEIMPEGRFQSSSAKPTSCTWTRGVVEHTFEMKVRRLETVADAKRYFGEIRKRQVSLAYVSEGTTRKAVRDRTGVADEAFTQDEWSTSFPQSHAHAWMRVSNVIIEIDAADFSSATLAGWQPQAALKAARTIADNLGNLT